MKLVTVSLVGLLVVLPLKAQEPSGAPVRPDTAPEKLAREHVVKKGDTLWDLAGFYFHDAFRWPIIYRANTSVVEDPHWIYPREVLVIPGLYESVARDATVAEVRPVARVREQPLRTVFYRLPPPPMQRSNPTVLGDPTMRRIPVTPAEYATAPFVADPEALTPYGQVIRPQRQMGDVSGIISTAHPKDLLYVSYASSARPRMGDRLLVVNVGEQVLGGRAMIPAGIVQVLRLDDEVMETRLDAQFDPVERGQLVIPLEMFPDFLAEAPEPVEGGGDLEGHLVRFVDRQVLYGPTDLGFIDLGSRDGVSVGDEFVAYVPSRASRAGGVGVYGHDSETLPAQTVGVLRVVHVSEASATVKVDQVVVPELEDGMQVRRVRKMP